MKVDNFNFMVCIQPPVIMENLVDLRARIDTAMQESIALPHTKEGMAGVKALRSDLNKIFQGMEEQRKAVKAAIMEPYEKANAEYQRLVVTPMKEADELFKRHIEETTRTIKKVCEDELKAYFDELVTQHYLPWLTFDRCRIKIDMATAQKKDWAKERQIIFDFVQRVDREMKTISAMVGAHEILRHYMQTLDLAQSIARVQKDKQDSAQALKALNDSRVFSESEKEHITHLAEDIPLEQKFTLTFTVRHTMPMLRGLKAFLESNKFEIVEDTEE